MLARRNCSRSIVPSARRALERRSHDRGLADPALQLRKERPWESLERLQQDLRDFGRRTTWSVSWW